MELGSLGPWGHKTNISRAPARHVPGKSATRNGCGSPRRDGSSAETRRWEDRICKDKGRQSRSCKKIPTRNRSKDPQIPVRPRALRYLGMTNPPPCSYTAAASGPEIWKLQVRGRSRPAWLCHAPWGAFWRFETNRSSFRRVLCRAVAVPAGAIALRTGPQKGKSGLGDKAQASVTNRSRNHAPPSWDTPYCFS